MAEEEDEEEEEEEEEEEDEEEEEEKVDVLISCTMPFAKGYDSGWTLVLSNQF